MMMDLFIQNTNKLELTSHSTWAIDFPKTSPQQVPTHFLSKYWLKTQKAIHTVQSWVEQSFPH